MVAGIASPGGASARILRNVLAARMGLVTSPEIREEYYSVASSDGVISLFARHGILPEFYRLELDALCLIAEDVTPTGRAPQCRDEDDRKYLHCAQFAAVDYVVSYDRDLLDVASMGDIPIVTPQGLLQHTKAAGIMLIE